MLITSTKMTDANPSEVNTTSAESGDMVSPDLFSLLCLMKNKEHPCAVRQEWKRPVNLLETCKVKRSLA